MKHLFVPYEIAILAKNKGFNDLCIKYIFTGNTGTGTDTTHYVSIDDQECYNDDSQTISVPMYQQLIDWFFDNKNIIVEICSLYVFNGGSEIKWMIKISNKYGITFIDGNNTVDEEFIYSNKKEALDKALEEAFRRI